MSTKKDPKNTEAPIVNFLRNIAVAAGIGLVFAVGIGLGYLISKPDQPEKPMYKDYEDAGIGITFSAEYLSIPNGWSVQKVQIEGMYPEGPAAKAGIQNGDEIIALDGVHVQTFESTAAIAAVLTDPKKMDIEITTMRDGIVKVWKLKKSRFACMYQEEEEIRNNEKRFFTSRDFEGTAWACTCTNVDGLD